MHMLTVQQRFLRHFNQLSIIYVEEDVPSVSGRAEIIIGVLEGDGLGSGTAAGAQTEIWLRPQSRW